MKYTLHPSKWCCYNFKTGGRGVTSDVSNLQRSLDLYGKYRVTSQAQTSKFESTFLIFYIFSKTEIRLHHKYNSIIVYFAAKRTTTVLYFNLIISWVYQIFRKYKRSLPITAFSRKFSIFFFLKLFSLDKERR